MPTYRITSDDGISLKVTGDKPPTPEDVDYLFAQHREANPGGVQSQPGYREPLTKPADPKYGSAGIKDVPTDPALPAGMVYEMDVGTVYDGDTFIGEMGPDRSTDEPGEMEYKFGMEGAKSDGVWRGSVRFEGINTPEMKDKETGEPQDGAELAKKFTQAALQDGKATVTSAGEGYHGRTVGQVNTSEGGDVNLGLKVSGLAEGVSYDLPSLGERMDAVDDGYSSGIRTNPRNQMSAEGKRVYDSVVKEWKEPDTSADWWDKMVYNLRDQTSLVGNWVDMARAATGLGGDYRQNPQTGEYEWYSEEDLYGPEWHTADYVTRKTMIQEKEREMRDATYRNRFGVDQATLDLWRDNPDSWADEVGAVLGEVDASILLGGPAVKGLTYAGKMAYGAAQGGAWSYLWSVTKQHAETNQIDPVTTIMDTVTGVTLGGAVPIALHAGNKARHKIGAKMAARRNISTVKPVDQMSQGEVKRLYRGMHKDAVNMWEETVKTRQGMPNTPDEAIAREAQEAHRIRTKLQAKYPSVYANPEQFREKLGFDLPTVTSDFATDKFGKLHNELTPGAGAIRQRAHNMSTTIGEYLGNPMTSIRNISARAYGDLARSDINFFKNTAYSDRVVKSMNDAASTIGRVSGGLTDKFYRKEMAGQSAWNSMAKGDWTGVFTHQNRAVRVASREVQRMLDSYWRHAKKYGMVAEGTEKIENYFPRYVKNIAKFWDNLNIDEKRSMKNYWNDYAKDKGITGGWEEMSDAMREEATSKWLESLKYEELGGKRPSMKNRRLADELYNQYFEHFHTPQEALLRYTKQMNEEFAVRKFFGVGEKTKRFNKETGKFYDALDHKHVKSNGVLDIKAAAADWAAKHGVKENLSDGAIKDLQKIIEVRFDPGRGQTAEWVSDLKAFTHGTLLAQFTAAATQLGDFGITMYKVGMRDTMHTILARGATNTKNVAKATSNFLFDTKFKKNQKWIDSQTDLGVNRAIYELTNQRSGRAGLVDLALKSSGFSTIDRINKNVLSEAALRKALRLSKDGKMKGQLFDKYAPAFGEEWTAKLYKDLRDMSAVPANRRHEAMSDTVKEYVLMEMIDAQPINISQMPLALQKSGANFGSLALSLMSYTMKAWDMARRDIVQEAKKGNIKKAAYNATKFSILVGGSNAAVQGLKDYMSGKDVYADEWPWRFVEELGGMANWDEYTRDDMNKKGDYINHWIQRLSQMPAFSVVSDMFLQPVIETYKWGMSMQEQQDTGAGWSLEEQGPSDAKEKMTKAWAQAGSKLPVAGRAVFGHNPINRDDRYNEQKAKERGKDKLYQWGQ